MNTRTFLIRVVGGVSFVLAGCASVTTTTDYPKDWPKAAIPNIGKCPDISGTYSIVSDDQRGKDLMSSGSVRPTSLADLIFHDGKYRGTADGTADVKQTDERLSFHFRYLLRFPPPDHWKTEGKTFIYGPDYSCDSKGIHLKPKGKMEGGALPPFIVGLGLSNKQLTFLKTVEGSLVASVMDSLGLVAIIAVVPIPRYESVNSWWRWKRVSVDGTTGKP